MPGPASRAGSGSKPRQQGQLEEGPIRLGLAARRASFLQPEPWQGCEMLPEGKLECDMHEGCKLNTLFLLCTFWQIFPLVSAWWWAAGWQSHMLWSGPEHSRLWVVVQGSTKDCRACIFHRETATSWWIRRCVLPLIPLLSSAAQVHLKWQQHLIASLWHSWHRCWWFERCCYCCH